MAMVDQGVGNNRHYGLFRNIDPGHQWPHGVADNAETSGSIQCTVDRCRRARQKDEQPRLDISLGRRARRQQRTLDQATQLSTSLFRLLDAEDYTSPGEART